MNIFVTGATGQLGGELQRLYPAATFLNRVDVDLASETSMRSYFQDKNPDLIINCSAYTQVDLAEKESDLAHAVNAVAPGVLASLSKRFVHFSTDYVFDGVGCRPYREDAQTGPTGIYGSTKLAGEQAAMASNPNSIVIRTSWVYSDLGKNFVKTILRLAQQKPELRVVADQVGSPTSAADLAEIVEQNLIRSNRLRPGVYHYSNEGVCSWYDFAVEVVQLAGLPCKVLPIRTEEYPTPAKRPSYSVLDKSKIKDELKIEIPHWKESLVKCLRKLS